VDWTPWNGYVAVVAILLATTAAACGESRSPRTSPPRGLELRASVTPQVVVMRPEASMQYRLEVTTGARAAAFGLTFFPPRYGRSPNRLEGALVDLRGAAAVSGPAVVSVRGGTTAVPACSPTRNRYHGYELKSLLWDVAAPANSVSVITLPFRLFQPLPPDADLTLTLVASPRLANGTHGTLARKAVRRARPRRLVGAHGVRVSFVTTPKSSPTPLRRVRQIEAGVRVVIHGRVLPRVAGTRVDVRAVLPGERRFVDVGHARTDAGGQFRYSRWRPMRRGRYEVWVFTQHKGPSDSGYACPRAFEVTAGE
jgi:hypothetical protein